MPIDMSAAKAPPRKRATATAAKATSPAAKASSNAVETKSELNQKRAEGLNGLGQLGQLLCVGTGNLADGAALGMHFPAFAQELANVADHSDAIAGPIDFLIQTGPYMALVAAATPLVLQLLANHKVLKAENLSGQGVVPPEVLESQMRAQVARIQADAARANQAAIAEARQAEAELQAYLAEVEKAA